MRCCARRASRKRRWSSALEQALRALLADLRRRAALRDAGRALARRFSWERTARETMAILDRVARPADTLGG